MSIEGLDGLRRLVRRLALLIAVVTALSIPIGYFAISHHDLAVGMRVHAEHDARELGQVLAGLPEPLRASSERLHALLGTSGLPTGAFHEILRHSTGGELLRVGPVPPRPWAEVIVPIAAGDESYGTLTLRTTLRPLLADTALAALFSFGLGGAIWLVLFRLPIRALARSEAELRRSLEAAERHAAETAHAYEELKRQHRLVEETTQELMKARDEALAADRAKSAFLATMSHELRTPLNAIIGFSEVLTLGVFGPLGNDRYRDYCQAIGDSGRHLLAVINDVLDISKIEAGKMQLHLEEVALERLLDSCCALVRGKADRAGVQLVLEHPEPALPLLNADPVKLKQVALNLLSNALKFTAPGGSIRIVSARFDGRGIGFSISDTGIGMRPEDVKVALKPFQQVDNSHTRRYEGTGLGLPLAKALVEQHGGALEIASVPGRGTTVTVVLPEQDGESVPPLEEQGSLDLQLPSWFGKKSA